MAEEFLEWVKLPHDLQAKFFQEAEREAERIVQYIRRIDREFRDLKPLLEKYFRKLGRSDRLYVVSAIDSSRSPRLSERLGVRYGVFAVGRLKTRGLERLSEDYMTGLFKRRQAFSKDKSRHFFSLLATYSERKMALKAVKDSDFVLIDGSFYGFIYEALRMKKQGFYGEEERKVLKDTFEATNRLIEEGKVLGVIKRSHSRIIGGWLALCGDRNNPYVNTIDKLILARLMPPGTLLNYRDLVGEDYPLPFYTTLARIVSSRGLEVSDPVNEALDKIYQPFKALDLPKGYFKELSRIQVKAYEGAPPCEIEYPRKVGLEKVMEWMSQPNFFNEITGLPITLDLVDNLINIPSRFTDEFVAEVEARVLDKLRGEDMDSVKLFFAFLNPQKPF